MEKLKEYKDIEIADHYEIHKIIFNNSGEVEVDMICDKNNERVTIKFIAVYAYKVLEKEKLSSELLKQAKNHYGIFEIENSLYKNSYKYQSMNVKDFVIDKVKNFIIIDSKKCIEILSIHLPKMYKQS